LRRIGLAIALLLIGLASSPAAGQTLSPGARAGMSVVEVQAARAAARPYVGQPVVGAQARLLEEGVSVAGHDWDARYYFEGDGLVLAVLTPAKAAPTTTYQAIFDAVVADLTQRHGQPFNCAYGPHAGKQECDWREPGRRIGVQLVTGLTPPLLEVAYRALGR
jgi:hypothetical protein